MTTIAAMRHTGNVRPYRALRPDPRGRNAVDLPFTTAQAAALARVLDEIRTGTAGKDCDRLALSGRNAGGAPRVPHDAPPATSTKDKPTRRNNRFPSISGAPEMTTA